MGNKVHTIVMVDLRDTEIYSQHNWVSEERVHSILTGLLTVDQKHTRWTLSRANLIRLVENPANFLQRLVTMDETWVHYFTKESK